MISTGLTAALLLAQAPPALLTLDDALREAQARSADLAAARARLDQASLLGWRAWSYHLPQVTAGATWTHNSSKDVTFPVGGVNVLVQKQDQQAGQLQATMALIAPGIWFGIAQARAGASAAEQGYEAGRRELLFGTAQLYYGAVGLKTAVRITERQVAIAMEHEKDARVRHQAGSTPKVALLRAEIDRAKAEQDLKATQSGYASARSALGTALGRSDHAFDVEVPAEPAPPAKGDDLEAEAVTRRPEVLSAQSALRAAQRGRGGVWTRYLPSLGAFYRYTRLNAGGITGQDESWAAGLALNWTLLDGTLREADLQDAGAKVAEAEANLRGAELRARDEVRRGQLDLEGALATREKARETVELARENQRLVEVSYRAGAATYLEVSDANAQLFSAELGAVTEDLKARLAVLRLLKAAGRFDPH